MKNVFLLLTFLSIACLSCKDDDTTAIDDYTVTININNPMDNSTHAISEMIPLEVVFSRGTDEIIHHVKIELMDSDGNVVETLLEEKTTKRIEPVNLPIPKRKVKAGFFGGGSVALSDSPLTPHGAISPGIGVFAGYKINDKWSVQAEVNLKKGFLNVDSNNEIVDVVTNTNTPSTYERLAASPALVAKNLTVLEFPILAKYKVNEKNSVMAGVRPSWIQVKDPNSDNNTLAVDAGNTMYQKMDVGISIGYERQLTDKLALNIRYNKGVTDLFEDAPTDEKYYNTDFQASIRYTLNP